MNPTRIPWCRPQPDAEPRDRPFWDHAAKGELAVQHCPSCGDMRFPASPVCPNCLAGDQFWRVVSGRATLESWTVFHKSYWPDLMPEVPYIACLVRLAEGPLLISNLLVEHIEPKVGMALTAAFVECKGPFTLPVFLPE